MGKLIYQNQFRFSYKNLLQIDFLSCIPIYLTLSGGMISSPSSKASVSGLSVSLDISHHNVYPFPLSQPGVSKHGIGFSNTRCRAKVDGQLSPLLRSLHFLRNFEQSFRGWSFVLFFEP